MIKKVMIKKNKFIVICLILGVSMLWGCAGKKETPPQKESPSSRLASLKKKIDFPHAYHPSRPPQGHQCN